MELYMVRHAESQANSIRQIQGWLNSPLTEKGRKQAEKTGFGLQCKGIKMIYASSLGRTLETASIINKSLNVPLVSTPKLKEMDVGHLEGLSWDDIKDRFPEVWHRLKENQSPLKAFPGCVENQDEFKQRIKNYISSIIEKHIDETVLVVTHAGPLGCFMTDILKIKLEDTLWPFEFSNCGVSRLHITVTAKVRVKQINALFY